VVSLFDGLAQEDVSLWRAGGPLLAMLVVALVVAAFELWRQRRKQAAMSVQQ
jgi:preprotein translocase subunit YajC